MRLMTAACLRSPLPLSENTWDWRVLSSLTEHWDHVDVLVKSPDRRSRRWQQGRIAAYYLPNLRDGLLGSASYLVCAVIVALGIHRRTPIAIFNASDPVSGLAGWCMRIIAGVPFVFHLQGELLEPPGAYGGRLKRLLLKGVTRFLCRHADRVRASYLEQARSLVVLGVRPGRISVLHMRCDTAQFDPQQWVAQREPLRQSLGLDNGVALLYLGRLIEGKGVDVLLRALPRIARETPDIRLIIVGDGPSRDAIVRLARELGVETLVSFTGTVPYDRVPSYLASADVFVFPSLTEASPRAVLEAMAMRLPVVACRVGGIPEMVVDGETGALVPPGDVDRLATALVDLTRSPERRMLMGRRARSRVQQRFAFEQSMREYQLMLRLTALRETFWSELSGIGQPEHVKHD